jgi:hypothetical protein
MAFFITVLSLPGWTPASFLHWQVPTIIVVFVVFMGKALTNTILFPKR